MDALVWLVARHHAGFRRGLCLDHGAPAMSDSAELPPPDTPPPAERRAWFPQRAVTDFRPGDARPARRPWSSACWSCVARAAAVASVLAPFVAAAGIAYVLDPPTTRLTRLGLSRGIAALLMIIGPAGRGPAVRPAALPADPPADRPAARPHPAIRPTAAALGERGAHRPAAELRLRRGERQAA